MISKFQVPGSKWFAFGLVAIVLASCSLDSYMFDPVQTSSYSLSNAVIPDSLREEVTFSSDGETLYGFYVRQVDSLSVEPHPVILYHHGNDENISYFWPRVELLWRAGFSVFIYDYKGYGRSGGKSETEESLLSDARSALNHVLSREEVDSTQIVQYGLSLGAVPAIHLATDYPSLAVIAEAAYHSGEAIVQSGTLLNIPGGYLLEGDFNNAQRIGRINTKLLMLHGVQDDFIPIDRHGDPLFEQAVNPKRYIRVEGAGHSDIPQVLGEQAYIDIITGFIRGS